VAQGFSVQVWGTWGRWFESTLPEKNYEYCAYHQRTELHLAIW